MLFLEETKSFGSKLVVGIETKAKDGTDYQQRCREILMLPYVDACIDETPPLPLIDLAWMEKSKVNKIVATIKEKRGDGNDGNHVEDSMKSNKVFRL